MASERQSPGEQEPARPTAVPPAGPAARPRPDGADGGEAACWAHLVCPECGAMESEGHLPRCESGRLRARDR